MKRFHVHVAVESLADSVGFYSALFGAPPTVHKGDYAKWMLEDPRVNFAISQRGSGPHGVEHLGLQVDSRDEFDTLGAQLKAAEMSVLPEEATTCCYAQSDKGWVRDPQGVVWETFYTFSDATTHHAAAGSDAAPAAAACCTPTAAVASLPASIPVKGKPAAKACC